MTNKQEKRKVAVLIPYYRKDEEIYVYIQRRSQNAMRLPGYFGFFGGGIEGTELPEEALLREIKEELNIEISNFEHFSKYEFYGSIIEVYTLEVHSDFADNLIVSEGDYGKFFSEQEIMNESKMIYQDKVVLSNFFGKLKRNNPYV